MHQRRPKRPSLRASGFAGLAVVLVFLFVLLHDAFQIAHSANDALLRFGEIFRRAIPLGTLIAAALFAVLAGGLVWFHIDALAACCKKISEHLKIRLPVLRYVVGAFSLAGILILALIFLPHGEDTPGTKKQQQPSRAPDEQPYQPKPTPPSADPPNESLTPESTLPKSTPRPRMADRDVCDLFEDPTDAEWNACVLYNRKHPELGGTGGPVCIMVHGRIECLPWPTPLPRPRPPLKILPNLN